MNYLIESACVCSPTNFIIAMIVKIIVFVIKYVVPLSLIIHGIIKFLDKKKKNKGIGQLVMKIIGAILISGLVLFVDLVLSMGPSVVVETENDTWFNWYTGECQPE